MEKSPTYPWLFRLIPAMTLKLVIILLTVPGLLFFVIELLGRDGEPWPMTWLARFASAGVLILGVLVVVGVVAIG